MKPKTVNAKNKKWDEAIDIGNGSTGKVAFEINPYQKPACGVSIKLRGVQVLDWVEYGGSKGGASYFSEEEGEDINAEDAVETAEELFKEEADVPF